MSVIGSEQLSDSARRADGRAVTVVSGIAVLLSVVAGGLVFGRSGVLAGGVLVAAWLVAPPIIVVALGQLLFAGLIPAETSLVAIAVVEAPLVLLFWGSVVDARSPLRTLALGTGLLAAFVAIVAGGVTALNALWHVGTLLVLVVAVVSYGLHRYTVVLTETTDEF